MAKNNYTPEEIYLEIIQAQRETIEQLLAVNQSLVDLKTYQVQKPISTITPTPPNIWYNTCETPNTGAFSNNPNGNQNKGGTT